MKKILILLSIIILLSTFASADCLFNQSSEYLATFADDTNALGGKLDWTISGASVGLGLTVDVDCFGLDGCLEYSASGTGDPAIYNSFSTITTGTYLYEYKLLSTDSSVNYGGLINKIGSSTGGSDYVSYQLNGFNPSDQWRINNVYQPTWDIIANNVWYNVTARIYMNNDTTSTTVKDIGDVDSVHSFDINPDKIVLVRNHDNSKPQYISDIFICNYPVNFNSENQFNIIRCFFLIYNSNGYLWFFICLKRNYVFKNI